MGLFYNYNFNIRLVEKTPGTEMFSSRGKVLKELRSDTALFKREPVCVLADPFLLEKDGWLHLFYECQIRHRGKGVLRMIRTKDLESWTEPVTVLEEPFHLSFPNVFEDNGRYYMLPETGADGSIRLYSSEDLVHWTLYRVILQDGRQWADSTIVAKDGKYFLISSVYNSFKDIRMHVFVSDSLDGEFRELPCSPVDADSSCARNAGSVFSFEGLLYRPAQDCSEGYGKNMSIMEITNLSAESYEERPAARLILDKTDGFFRRGGHQFNPVVFRGRTIVALDGKQRNYNIIDKLRSFRKK